MFLTSRYRFGAASAQIGKLAAAAVLAGLNACASSTAQPTTQPTPVASTDWSRDPRNNLRAGLFDAQEAVSNLRVTARVDQVQESAG